MAGSNKKWYFTKDQLENTPSKRYGIDPLKELSYRQQAANFIQAMGQKLKVNKLCISTATVYMHRFYVYHSFTHFSWESIATATLFLAAKVVEQPRKLEHIIWAGNICKNSHHTNCDVTSDRYRAQLQDLIFNEIILLQTLGFNVMVEQPHKHILFHCQRVGTGRDLTDAFCVIASKSLRLTTMCLQYKPTVVACFCIYFVCKWFNWEIPFSSEDSAWFLCIDDTVTPELLEQLTKEYLHIYETYQKRLKDKLGDRPPPHEPNKKPESSPAPEHNHQKIERPCRLPHEPGPSATQPDHDRHRWKNNQEPTEHQIKSRVSGTVPDNHTPARAEPPPNPWAEPRDFLEEATRTISLQERKEIKQGLVTNGALPDVTARQARDRLVGPDSAPGSANSTNGNDGRLTNNLVVFKPCNLESEIRKHLSTSLQERKPVKRPSMFSPPKEALPRKIFKTDAIGSTPMFGLPQNSLVPKPKIPDAPNLSDFAPAPRVKEDKVGSARSGEKPKVNHVQLGRPLMYSIETDPSIISSLLKEVPDLSGLGGLTTGLYGAADRKPHKKHKKDKKKKKHRCRDKEKSRGSDDRKEKYAVQDRVARRYGGEAEDAGISGKPIKITISKEKVRLVEDAPSNLGIKIRLSKNKIMTITDGPSFEGNQLKIQ